MKGQSYRMNYTIRWYQFSIGYLLLKLEYTVYFHYQCFQDSSQGINLF